MKSPRTRKIRQVVISDLGPGMPSGRDALQGAMTPGVIALVAALAVALAGGGIWRRNNGRMRTPAVARAAAVAGVPIPTEDPADPAMPADAADAGLTLSADQIGHPLGERATLLQFSSAFCAPCRATRRVLAEVAGMTEGVAHIEIDAEARLDLVRELNVLRTPTVLVLAGDGRIVRRASGQPRKPDVIAAIGAAVGV
jgi:thiol-disulfide isomerase/thioredoxin